MKLANQKFTSIKNDFCVVFDRNGDIVEVPEDDSIQEKGFNFVGVKDIGGMDRTKVVDIIGILHYVGPIIEVQTKQGVAKEKRMISVADESGCSIQVCCWAD